MYSDKGKALVGACSDRRYRCQQFLTEFRCGVMLHPNSV